MSSGFGCVVAVALAMETRGFFSCERVAKNETINAIRNLIRLWAEDKAIESAQSGHLMQIRDIIVMPQLLSG